DLVLPEGFGRDDGDDESVERWFERRLGRELASAVASPLLGGLYTGDISTLSLHAAFPQLAELEGKGGAIRAAIARAPAPKHPPPSGFVSLRRGMGSLVEPLAARLGDVVRTNAPVTRIDPFGAQWSVGVEGAHPVVVDHVAITGPAYVAASLLRAHDAAL